MSGSEDRDSDGEVLIASLEGAPSVAVITVDRPPVNALSLGQYKRVSAAFAELETRMDLRCIILTGGGDRAFIGGADVKQLSERSIEITLERSVWARRCFDAVRNAPVPVIGAINGAAVGAGLVVASQCDVLIASENAKFALPEIIVGVLGGTRHAGRVMPEKMMRYMAVTGQPVAAQRLYDLGMVHEIVPAGSAFDRASELARIVATRSPAILRMMKEAINLTEEMPLGQGYRTEQLFTTIATAHPDSKEAALAWLEKRSPAFGG